ncbi:MAG: hypothetical protein ACOYOU_12950 [Kiritimatiellia bacterium]
MNILRDILACAGRRPVVASFHDGSRVLVVPGNGRVIGLYPAEGDANFLWTNPALAGAVTAQTYFSRPGWANPGGDRTWLAPEIELFICDLSRVAETYAVQPTLDPGNWTLIEASAAEISLANVTRLRLLRQNREIGVRLGRSVSPAANPLQGTSAARVGLRYAGYTLTTTLELELQAGDPIRLGIWNLLQLPQPGVMLIPTCEATCPQVVFGSLSSAELTVTPTRISWNMAPPGGDGKISIRAAALTGRAGYLRETGTPGLQDLVVREFAVGAPCEYVDALWTPPYETGWGFQACCVRNGAECFNELEYHVPAAVSVAGRNHSRDVSRVWAFRGPSGAIAQAAETLLGTCRT